MLPEIYLLTYSVWQYSTLIVNQLVFWFDEKYLLFNFAQTKKTKQGFPLNTTKSPIKFLPTPCGCEVGRRSITTISKGKEQDSIEYNSKTLLNKAVSDSCKTIPNNNSYHLSLSEENFLEWFRGLVDGEGCFYIKVSDISIRFRFDIYMHKDDSEMLKYIAERLGVGRVYIGDHFTSYVVSNQKDLLNIISIFDKYPLNTTKNLNFISFKKGYILYYNRTSSRVSPELREKILNIKNHMNKLQVNFKQPDGHEIKITPYWLLGLTEGEGYFSVASKTLRMEFGLGLTAGEIEVLKGIQEFLLGLPGQYKITRKDTNVLGLLVSSKAKDENSKPMARLYTYKTDYITNVLVPYFDSLTWLSKKELDYRDWKLILRLKNQGKHFMDEGKEVISLIANGMNNNRLSSNLPKKRTNLSLSSEDIQKKAIELLSLPSNYELQLDGKILIKSSGSYLKGRGNLGVKVVDEEGKLIFNFNSIKDCALFFNVHSRTIIRKLDQGNTLEFKGQNLVFKREVSLLP
uniref:LAGLIDADG endonuclease n=1 Tax=Ophiognomonia clavigignenti-juglandacearum TaxID=218668 RepID=A0A2C9DSD0_9PEZI|nr:LAGLIDADG endonuclease [Ophiognomonia clavigignenti-juglandacearum]